MPLLSFPDLKSVVIEWEDHVSARGDAPGTDGAYSHSLRGSGGKMEGLVPCPNPRCRSGGFEVGFLVDLMVSERADERIGVLVCIGWEQGDDDTGKREPCTRAIRYRIRLIYRRPVVRPNRDGDDGKGREEQPSR
jgi:hypothetical protein